jgi:hypothetical protein
MPKLSSDTFQGIVEVLLPHMETEANRRSLVAPVLSNTPVYGQVDWSGAPRSFTVRLVQLLDEYGEIESGKQALTALLEYTRTIVGIEQQKKIDILIGALETPSLPVPTYGHKVVHLRPLDMTHGFVGREDEVDAFCRHLRDDSVRLICVVGRPGRGKTALASYVLGGLEREVPLLPDGEELPVKGMLYLRAQDTGLGLESIYTGVRVMLEQSAANLLAARWASRQISLAVRIESLLEVTQDGLYLILLDNLEDYLGQDGAIEDEGLRLFVEHCLVQPSGLKLIATSREEIRLPPAALRNVRRISLHGLPQDEAVALLRDLDAQGMAGLRNAPPDELRRATQLARGVPRSLEIVAGILHYDPAANLSSLLADETTSAEVMEQLVAEGYGRLGDDERRVIEALAVYNGPVQESAIIYLLQPWYPTLDVRACLRRLARSHFVNVNRQAGTYSLHPVDCNFAYNRIPRPSSPSACD